MNSSWLKKSALVCLLILCCTGAVFTENGTAIVQKSLDVKRPYFTHSAVKMILLDSKGNTEERMLEEWAKDTGDKTGAAVIVFRKPASVKDARFLQIIHKDRANDKWIYLPALRTVRRIAGAEGAKSFMGTDADYDDLETRKIEQDTHTLLGEAKVGLYDCWKIESIPVDPKSSRYSKKIAYIDKASFVPVKVEMYDKKGTLLKVLHIETLEHKQGYWIPMKTKLANVQTNHTTVLEILKIELDKPVSDALFTQNFLNTGRL